MSFTALVGLQRCCYPGDDRRSVVLAVWVWLVVGVGCCLGGGWSVWLLGFFELLMLGLVPFIWAFSPLVIEP